MAGHFGRHDKLTQRFDRLSDVIVAKLHRDRKLERLGARVGVFHERRESHHERVLFVKDNCALRHIVPSTVAGLVDSDDGSLISKRALEA